MEAIKINSSGEKVTDIQRRLKLLGYDFGRTDIDGVFGRESESAVMKFQQDRGLVVTGVMDQETWQELADAGYKVGERMLYLKYPPFRGDDIRTLQFWLKTLGFYHYNENGIFCEKTHKALLEFQNNMNIDDDGIVGEETIRNLKNLERIIMSRETSNFPLAGNTGKAKKLQENRIILDYSENIEDLRSSREHLGEKIYILSSIVNFCRDMLTGNGIETMVSISGDEKQNVFLYDRVEYINKSDSDLLISIDLNYSVDRNATGSSCFYFKGLKSYSIEGHRIAGMIQDELVGGLDVLDCRANGANYAILKATSIVSALVKPGFISNTAERERLKKSSYQKKISKGIVKAILEYLAG